MAADTPIHNRTLEPLEKTIATVCFCKLRNKCEDKNSVECWRHRNVYAEAMLARDSSQ
jgi:hypothetical protein